MSLYDPLKISAVYLISTYQSEVTNVMLSMIYIDQHCQKWKAAMFIFST